MAKDDPPPPPPLVERRPKPRRRVFLSGKVAYFGGDQSFTCAIRDISEGGARIVLQGHPVPTDVFLVLPRERVAHEARVVWNNGREAGLSFRRSLNLSEVTDPKLAFLKRLCT